MDKDDIEIIPPENALTEVKPKGRPQHKVDDINLAVVQHLYLVGVPLEEIARRIGIAFNTLKKHYGDHLQSLKNERDAMVVAKLFGLIKDNNPAAIFFYMKTQMGMKENHTHEHTIRHEISEEEVKRRIEEIDSPEKAAKAYRQLLLECRSD